MPTFDALRARQREAKKAASAKFLILAAALALSLGGCGSANAGGGGGEPEPDVASADDGNSDAYTTKEANAADPEMLEAMEELVYHAQGVKEDTRILVNGEQERATQKKEDLEKVEDFGREQIELAREDSKTWSSEKDPLCEDAVPFPHPGIGYDLLPPYQYPYDWRREATGEQIGVTKGQITEARKAIAVTKEQAKANPDDPLVDESKVAVAYAEEQIERAEEELAQGEEIQRQITEQEKKNEALYKGWEKEYQDELYSDSYC